MAAFPTKPASCFCQSDACKQSKQCLYTNWPPFSTAPGRQKFPLDLRCHTPLTSQISPLSQLAPMLHNRQQVKAAGRFDLRHSRGIVEQRKCQGRLGAGDGVSVTSRRHQHAATQHLSAMPWNRSSFGQDMVSSHCSLLDRCNHQLAADSQDLCRQMALFWCDLGRLCYHYNTVLSCRYPCSWPCAPTDFRAGFPGRSPEALHRRAPVLCG